MSKVEKNPILNELQALKQRMDALYSESFREQESKPDKDREQEQPQPKDIVSWRPTVDIWEMGEKWLIYVDLPGVGDEDLQVEVLDNQLVIEGKRQTAPLATELKVFQAERPEGYFCRRFILPYNVQQEAINAELKRGVLTVTIPKDVASRGPSHRIVVQSE